MLLCKSDLANLSIIEKIDGVIILSINVRYPFLLNYIA